jgi:hypothetical protein
MSVGLAEKSRRDPGATFACLSGSGVHLAIKALSIITRATTAAAAARVRA